MGLVPGSSGCGQSKHQKLKHSMFARPASIRKAWTVKSDIERMRSSEGTSYGCARTWLNCNRAQSYPQSNCMRFRCAGWHGRFRVRDCVLEHPQAFQALRAVSEQIPSHVTTVTKPSWTCTLTRLAAWAVKVDQSVACGT
eukprot:6433598-Amphidinium_carterae.1